MTTATDWDVRDRETNDRLTVTDVKARIDQLDGAATEAPVQIEPWIPRDPHARERCRCGEYHESALIAPASNVLYAEGSTIAAEMVRGIDRTPGWPTWLGAVHHADARLGSEIAKTHAWADQYTARPVERTVVQPVEVDYSYQQSEAALYARMVVEAAEEHVDSVYSELAPDRIHADVPPDDRVQRMIDDPETYFAEARERAERQVQAESGADLEAGPPADRSGLDKLKERVPTALTTGEATTQVGGPEPTSNETGVELEVPEPRKPWWRREWVAAAGIGVLWAAAIGVLVVLA